jgi:hypothetical protein
MPLASQPFCQENVFLHLLSIQNIPKKPQIYPHFGILGHFDKWANKIPKNGTEKSMPRQNNSSQ